MADVVLIDLRASYEKFKQDTAQAIGALDKVDAAGKKAGADVTKSFNNAGTSVAKFGQQINAATQNTSKNFERTTSTVRGLNNAVDKAGGTAPARLNTINKSLDNVTKTTKTATTAFNGMGTSLVAMGATLGVGLGIQAFIGELKSSIKEASDLGETVSKTGELFGTSTNKVLEWSKTTDTAFGLSQKAALDGASSFAIFGRAAGLSGNKLVDFSQDFVGLASDLASFNNTSPEEALLAISAALRGESEPIRRYGVLLDDMTLRHEAVTLGIIKTTKTALTPQQRVLAAQAAIYKQTAAAQGDFERTSGGLANQQRILSAEWTNLKAVLGQELLPVVLDLTKAMNALVAQDFSNDGLDKLAGGFDRVATLGKILPGPMSTVTNAFKSFRGALSDLQDGKILAGIGGYAEGLGNVLTLGLYTTIKDRLIPTTNKYKETLTDFQKTQLAVANATDDELRAEFERLHKETGITDEAWNKFVGDIKAAALETTFRELAKAIKITREQYAQLTAISDQYGISSRINSSLILDIKQSTEGDLNKAFEKFNKTLGVTRKDFNDYIGIVEKIPPVSDAANKSTVKLIGPYEALGNAVSKAMGKLQDQATLFMQSKGDWEDVIAFAKKYAEGQNELVAVNTKVQEALKRTPEATKIATTSMETVSITGSKLTGTFGALTGGIVNLMNTSSLLGTQTIAKLLITADQLADAETRAKDHSIKTAEELVAHRTQLFQQLGINQQSIYEKNLEEIEKLQAAEIAASDGTMASIAKIIEKYSQAITVNQLQQTASFAGALADLGTSLGTALGEIFGDAAKDSAVFAAFQKAISIATITFKSFEAIMNGIASITAGGPLGIIQGIASIATGIGSLVGGLIQQVQGTEIPAPPTFFKGTEDTGPGGSVDAKGGFYSILHPHEGVVHEIANKQHPGAVKALNDGSFDQYIVNRWISPGLLKNEAKEKNNLAQNIADALLIQQGNKFDDFRLFRTAKEHIQVTKESNSLLKRSLKKNSNRNLN